MRELFLDSNSKIQAINFLDRLVLDGIPPALLLGEFFSEIFAYLAEGKDPRNVRVVLNYLGCPHEVSSGEFDELQDRLNEILKLAFPPLPNVS